MSTKQVAITESDGYLDDSATERISYIILELSQGVKFLCVCGQKDTREQNNTLITVRLRSERWKNCLQRKRVE